MKKIFYILCFSLAVLLSACEKDESSNSSNGHEYVDLGLSVKWATCNVGADSPEDYGDYFAWGETQPKSYYWEDSYKWFDYKQNYLTKYCTDSDYGTVDNKTVLELTDDAANANWGGSWRMPTNAEQIELVEKCTWTWGKKKGINGCTVTGPNGNSIFIPATGYRYQSDLVLLSSLGYYWSNSLSSQKSHYVDMLCFFPEGAGYDYFDNRTVGLPVRPVLP